LIQHKAKDEKEEMQAEKIFVTEKKHYSPLCGHLYICAPASNLLVLIKKVAAARLGRPAQQGLSKK
jgi:hypothetical protein